MTHTEQFTINKRPGWGAAITVTIACDPAAPYGVKLGLAVRVGREDGADLGGADLTGADLTGANLRGANLGGEKVTRIIARLQREIDPYPFTAFGLEAGGYKIQAGCRWFTDAEFRAHVAAEYPDTPKAVETLAILDFIAARASVLIEMEAA
jgi:hypothetical protein